MNNHHTMAEYIINEMRFLSSHGFYKQATFPRDSQSDIYFFSRSIAIQFELDWRESSIFCLIVKLNLDGSLPNGYYGDGQGVCRLHLKTYIIKNKLNCDHNYLNKISNLGRVKTQERNKEFMMKTFFIYKELLLSCIDEILLDRNEM